jgi:regulator of RNase E activity RraB
MPLFRRTRDEEPVGPHMRSPELGLELDDLLLLDQLIKAGADLTQPRHVLHYLYFSSGETAAAAAAEAVGHGFTVEVREPIPENPGQWCVVCEIRGIVLDPVTVRDHSDLFSSLAQRHTGEYDGWEASV